MKFHGNNKIPRLGLKFHDPQKTVGPTRILLLLMYILWVAGQRWSIMRICRLNICPQYMLTLRAMMSTS